MLLESLGRVSSAPSFIDWRICLNSCAFDPAVTTSKQQKRTSLSEEIRPHAARNRDGVASPVGAASWNGPYGPRHDDLQDSLAFTKPTNSCHKGTCRSPEELQEIRGTDVVTHDGGVPMICQVVDPTTKGPAVSEYRKPSFQVHV